MGPAIPAAAGLTQQSVVLWVLVLCTATASAHQLHIKNSCAHTVWPGILANFGFPHPECGGFRLDPGDARSLYVNVTWGGRIWGRTECNETNGRCMTGDCGDLIECNGFSGSPPLNFVDIKFDGIGELDYYYLSLVDGYNLQLEIRPVPNTVEEGGGGPFDCQPAGCVRDLNPLCPPELWYTRSSAEDRQNSTLTFFESADDVIACMSPCVAFNTEEYCCRGAYDDPLTCRGELWPINYTQIVKLACPTAFSYVHDQTTRQSTCRSREPDSSSYEIVFCPRRESMIST